VRGAVSCQRRLRGVAKRRTTPRSNRTLEIAIEAPAQCYWRKAGWPYSKSERGLVEQVPGHTACRPAICSRLLFPRYALIFFHTFSTWLLCFVPNPDPCAPLPVAATSQSNDRRRSQRLTSEHARISSSRYHVTHLDGAYRSAQGSGLEMK
jgi:hypothetical protein